MKLRHPAILAMAVLLGGGTAHAAGTDPVTGSANPAPQPGTATQTSTAPQTGSAQPTMTPPASSTAAAQPDAAASKAEDMRASAVKADHAAFFDAHVAALHAGLGLAPDQEAMWPPVEQAIRGFARMRAEMMRRPEADTDNADQSPMQELKRTSEQLLARGQALKALADASEPLYQSLNPDQKRRLPVLLEGLAPRGGPVGRMVAMLRQDARADDTAEPGRDREHDGGAMDREPMRSHRHWRDDRRSDFAPETRDPQARIGRDDREDGDWADRNGWQHRERWADHGRDRGYADRGIDRDHADDDEADRGGHYRPMPEAGDDSQD